MPKIIAEGACNEHISWSFNDKGTLIINGIGAMPDYHLLYNIPWYSQYKSDIIKLIIEPNITYIGSLSFALCKNLKKVFLPETITKIGNHAFSYCESLINIAIPESVVSICDCVFYYCSNLKSVKLPKNVKMGHDVFVDCPKLLI